MSEIEIVREALAKADAELEAPPINLAAALDRARRHVVGRITRAAAIGGVGAVLLLAGGLTARAANTNGGGGSSGGGPAKTTTEPSTEPTQQETKEEKEKRKEQEERRKRSGEELPNLTVSAAEGATVELLVSNDSSAAAGPFQVTATVSGRVVGQESFEGLEAEASESVTFRCVGPLMVVEVDSGAQVRESNEEDNRTEVKCAPEETTEEATTGSTETTEIPTTTETTESTESTEVGSPETPR
ncbi:MAG TPA: CARDB domain-containing protein [Solirubrobacterales bacterium]|jgi:hypothetical protein